MRGTVDLHQREIFEQKKPAGKAHIHVVLRNASLNAINRNLKAEIYN